MATGTTERKLYTPEDVAAIFHVTPRTIHEWLKEGKLKGLRTPSKTWLVEDAEVQALIERGREAAEASRQQRKLPATKGVTKKPIKKPIKKSKKSKKASTKKAPRGPIKTSAKKPAKKKS